MNERLRFVAKLLEDERMAVCASLVLADTSVAVMLVHSLHARM